MNSAKVLPSETVQKEFELNPLKILESLGPDNFEEDSNSDTENDQAELTRKSSEEEEEKEDINNDKYINNLTCTNSLINCSQNNLKEINNFKILFNPDVSCKYGKTNEVTFINSNINHVHDINTCNYISNDNSIDTNDLSLSKNNNMYKNDFMINSNVVNNVINISKILSNLKTYKGSIYAQSLLERINSEEDLNNFFIDIIPNICKIMCLEYGNYFFQKLIKKLTLSQKLQIYQIIYPDFLFIATNRWGTHSVQSLIDNIQSTSEYQALNLLISKNMLLLFTDDNAYHIMMKIILDFPEEQRFALNLFLVTNVEKIITNNNGAFCVNKFIVNNKNLELRKLLIENFNKNFKSIIFNKYCCINLLLILQTFGLEWGGFIISQIKENFINLIDNPVSRVFVMKVLELLKNNYYFILKELLWSLYKNIVLMRYLVMNKKKKKILNQLIEYSDNEQKQFLLFLSKRCIW